MTADRTPGHGGNAGLCSECDGDHDQAEGAGAFLDSTSLAPSAAEPRVIPTTATLLDGLAATRAADEKAREQRLPWSAP